MKIMICGSSTFAKEMIELAEKLNTQGHKAVSPIGMEPHLTDPTFTDNLSDNLEFCIKHDIMRKNFTQVSEQDAIIVFNKKKNNIDGYVGTSVLMEMAIAHFLHKKIFIMYPIPDFYSHRWAHEVSIMQPVILNQDLTKITE